MPQTLALAFLGYDEAGSPSIIGAVTAITKHKFQFSLFWAPLTVLAVIVAAGFLLTNRYRPLSATASGVVIVLAAALELYTYFEETHAHYNRAIFATIVLVLAITLLEFEGVAHLISMLVTQGKQVQGAPLLASGAYLWASNVLSFGLWFWLFDRGGPHAREFNTNAPPDFFFPEMAAGDFVSSDWTPGIAEYMYLAFTNATAFSPTDTLPLTSRARIFMTAESILSLVIIALVMARAVNILA